MSNVSVRKIDSFALHVLFQSANGLKKLGFTIALCTDGMGVYDSIWRQYIQDRLGNII